MFGIHANRCTHASGSPWPRIFSLSTHLSLIYVDANREPKLTTLTYLPPSLVGCKLETILDNRFLSLPVEVKVMTVGVDGAASGFDLAPPVRRLK